MDCIYLYNIKVESIRKHKSDIFRNIKNESHEMYREF